MFFISSVYYIAQLCRFVGFGRHALVRCSPSLPTDGFVVLSCQEPVTSRASGQLLYDQLTDSVVSAQPAMIGEPYLTPDSADCVTVDRRGDVTTLAVQRLDGQCD